MAPRRPRIGIIGAGMSGIATAILLRQKLASLDFVIFEKFSQVGGTWHQNLYPGLSCDVPSFSYHFTFEPWHQCSRPFPERQETLDYCIAVSEKYLIRPHIRFNTDVTSARWDEETSEWVLSLQECKNGYTEELGDELGEFRCDVVFNFRKGAFHPTFPEILGAKEKVFEGKAWHTMNWPSDGTEYLTGKRVAIVGCAAAGIQVSATIAPLVKSMVIYHRTPNHIVPRPNALWSEEQKKAWKENPWVWKMWRAQRGMDENYATWKVIADPKGPQAAAFKALAKSHMEATITDEKLRKILYADYAPFARRILVSDDFYKTVMMDHVELVQETIEAITPKGIRSNANDPIRPAEHVADPQVFDREFDVIIYCTGFDFKRPAMPVYGRGGKTHAMKAVEIGDVQSYFGSLLDDFPNYANGTGLYTMALDSYLANIEANVSWVIKLIDLMIRRNWKTFEPTRDAAQKFSDLMDSYMQGTSFREPCPSSYYKIPLWDGSGRFRTPLFFPGMLAPMEYLMSQIQESDFKIEKYDEPNHWARGGEELADEINEIVANKRDLSSVGDGGDARVKEIMEMLEKRTVASLPDKAKVVEGGDGRGQIRKPAGIAKNVEAALSALAGTY